MRYCLLVIYLFCSLVLPGKERGIVPMTNYVHLGEDEGLTTKTIYNIIQDKEGFMWLATDAGVFRYDGRSFRHFTVDDGITDNEVLNIYQDKLGRIWFMTLNGNLSYWLDGSIYNPDNTAFLKEANVGVSIITCFEDKFGSLWFGGMKSGWIVLDTLQKVKKYIWPAGNRHFIHYHACEGVDGSVWYFSRYGIIRFDGSDTIPLRLNQTAIAGCHSDKQSEFFYSSYEGIYRVYDCKLTLFVDSIYLPFSEKIINMRAEQGELWICTIDNGCYLVQDSTHIQQFLPSTSVTCVQRDREGNLWFSTMGEGIFILYNNSEYITNYDETSGLSDSRINCVSTDEHGAIWLGYKNGMVDKIQNDTVKSYLLLKKNEISYCRIVGIELKHDTAWCGTDLRVCYIHDDKVNFVKYLEPEGWNSYYAIKQLIFDKNESIMAVTSLNMTRMEKYGNEYFAVPLLDSVLRMFSALAIDQNKYLVAGMDGISEFWQGHHYRKLHAYDAMQHERILDMVTDSDGLYLFASNSNGLFVFENEKLIQHLTVSNGLSDNNCRRIFLIDSLLYIATGNGLDILTKSNHTWQVSGVLTTKNGLLSNSINDVCADRNKLYVVSDKGLSVINRKSSQSSIFSSKVIITELVADKPYNTKASLFSFRVDVPRILIRFAYPVYNPLNRMKFKYRLVQNNEGKREWTISNNNEVEFSSLNPGNYEFQVAPDISTVSPNQISKLSLEIRPLWWQTLSAKFFFALLLTMLAIFVIRKRIKSQYEKRLAELKQITLLETERNRIASDMHDDIGADLTQISIWSNILKEKIQNEGEIVKKVSGLSNEVLQKMDQIIWALNSINNHTTNLLSYLHSYASEYLESVDIDLDFKILENIPDLTISAFQRRNIFLTVKELLHNTVKHSGARNVKIHISLEGRRLIIEYADDGTGIQEQNKRTGLGMTTLFKRMHEINSSIVINEMKQSGFHARLDIDIQQSKLKYKKN